MLSRPGLEAFVPLARGFGKLGFDQLSLRSLSSRSGETLNIATVRDSIPEGGGI